MTWMCRLLIAGTAYAGYGLLAQGPAVVASRRDLRYPVPWVLTSCPHPSYRLQQARRDVNDDTRRPRWRAGSDEEEWRHDHCGKGRSRGILGASVEGLGEQVVCARRRHRLGRAA